MDGYMYPAKHLIDQELGGSIIDIRQCRQRLSSRSIQVKKKVDIFFRD